MAEMAQASPDALPEALRDQEQMMPGFARWMYRTVRSELGPIVLDAGAGIGTFTELLVNDGRCVEVLETETDFIENIRKRFAGRDCVGIYEGNLADKATLEDIQVVDSVLCLNVLEHVEDDLTAMENLLLKTRPGGKLVALVPGYPALFNRMDTAVGHYRRYRKTEFAERLALAGWEVERVFRFNAFGIPGWFISGNLLRRSTPGRTLYKLFDTLVPLFSFLERLFVRGAVGLSIVAICRRPDGLR